jgi:hypothetical protein
MINFAELMERQEDLNSDLIRHITEGPLGQMIHHPLIIEIAYNPKMNAFINARYRHKLAAIESAKAAGQFYSIIFMHERPYRLEALKSLAPQMSDAEYWNCVGGVWVDSENIWQNLNEWRNVWESKRSAKFNCMDEEEREVFAALPNTIKVYRGVHGKGCNMPLYRRNGLSWTTSYDTAEWFSKRHKETRQKILMGTVDKKDVHAYFSGRNENEIVASNVK